MPAAVPLSPETSTYSPTTSKRPVDRLLELRLWHYFSTSTYKTLLTNDPAANIVWCNEVPAIAFAGKPYLADALLAVTALHLRSQYPDDRALVHACHAYSASALSAYLSTLNGGINADNAEALFLTSSMIAFHACASRIFIKDDGDATPTPRTGRRRYEIPTAWFHAFQGVKTVVATSWQWIRHSQTAKAIIDSQPSFQLDMNPLGMVSFFGHLLENLEQETAHEPPQQAFFTNQGYFHAVSVLNWAHRTPYPPSPLAFPATVSKRFIELIEERRPRALAILACFFALLKRMEGVWWLGDVARREVMGLVSLFEPGSTWWRHLEWPIRIALYDGDLPVPPGVWGIVCEEKSAEDTGLTETMMTHIEMLAKMNNAGPQSPAGSVTDELPGLSAVPLD